MIMVNPCHKSPRIYFACRNRNNIFSFFINHHRICNKSNTKGATIGEGTAHPFGTLQFNLSEHFGLPIVCSGVHVARSLLFCACFVDQFVLMFFFLLTFTCPS